MKKTYETPELQTEAFDVEDVITVSGGNTLANKLQQVADTFEDMMDNFGDMISFGS